MERAARDRSRARSGDGARPRRDRPPRVRPSRARTRPSIRRQTSRRRAWRSARARRAGACARTRAARARTRPGRASARAWPRAAATSRRGRSRRSRSPRCHRPHPARGDRPRPPRVRATHAPRCRRHARARRPRPHRAPRRRHRRGARHRAARRPRRSTPPRGACSLARAFATSAAAGSTLPRVSPSAIAARNAGRAASTSRAAAAFAGSSGIGSAAPASASAHSAGDGSTARASSTRSPVAAPGASRTRTPVARASRAPSSVLRCSRQRSIAGPRSGGAVHRAMRASPNAFCQRSSAAPAEALRSRARTVGFQMSDSSASSIAHHWVVLLCISPNHVATLASTAAPQAAAIHFAGERRASRCASASATSRIPPNRRAGSTARQRATIASSHPGTSRNGSAGPRSIARRISVQLLPANGRSPASAS